MEASSVDADTDADADADADAIPHCLHQKAAGSKKSRILARRILARRIFARSQWRNSAAIFW